ncbi:hypothetical protein [Hyphomonas sp.]|uniref:hypothetical protein n=1 Tax=Hyphomonas sp. TaxID=87 RepID=UPI00351355CC
MSLRNLNWKMGTLRLWMVLSAIWIFFMSFALYGAYDFLNQAQNELSQYEAAIKNTDAEAGLRGVQLVSRVSFWETQIFWGWLSFLIPLAVLTVGYAVIWVAQGFRSAEK